MAVLVVGMVQLPADASAASCATPSKVTLSASQVVATSTVSGKVRLKCKVGRSVRVQLSGSGLTVPTSVVVRKRKLTASFTAKTLPVASTRNALVVASVGKVRRTDTVKVLFNCSSQLAAVSLPKQVFALESVSGSVRLACAPRSSVTVALSSNDANITVPSRVTVPAGRTTVQFPVAAKKDGDQRTVSITGRYAGASRTASIEAFPTIALVEIAAHQDYVNVPLTGCLRSGIGSTVPVTVTSSSPALKFAASNHLSSCGGMIEVSEVLPVAVDTTVTVTVKLSKRSLSATTVLLRPAGPGDGATVRVRDTGPYIGPMRSTIAIGASLSHPAPAGGVQVVWSVRGGNPALVRDGAQDIDRINEGETSNSADFATGTVTATTVVIVDALINGHTYSVSVTIEPAMAALTLPATVDAGVPFTGTLTMAGPSTTEQKIYLSASEGGTEVPFKLTLPAGQTSIQFSMTVTAPHPSDPDGSYGRQISAYRPDTEGFRHVDEIDSNYTIINH